MATRSERIAALNAEAAFLALEWVVAGGGRRAAVREALRAAKPWKRACLAASIFGLLKASNLQAADFFEKWVIYMAFDEEGSQ